MAAEVPYKSGLGVKPARINNIGLVTFTDGTNEITPNQKQCEAYGYKYDKATGTCTAFRFAVATNRKVRKEGNTISGVSNKTEAGTMNTYVMGESNQVNRASKNNIVVGANNKVNTQIQNTALFGIGGVSLIDGAMVFGGNALDDKAGTRQTITLMYGCDTTDNSTTDSFPNNTEGYFEPEANRVYYFQSETLAVRTGGSSASGAVGDFKAWVERGVVKCNSAGTLSIDRSRTSPADSGTTTGWSPINAVSGSNFRQTVKGANNMNIKWVSTIRFMQLFTNALLP